MAIIPDEVRREAEREHDRLQRFEDSTNEATINTANLALRTAMLVNGGAAVTVLAFIGGLISKGGLTLKQLAG
jgi:hypothetical protein